MKPSLAAGRSAGHLPRFSAGHRDRGQPHPDGPPETACYLHWRFGKSAFKCKQKATCPWKNFCKPKPTTKTDWNSRLEVNSETDSENDILINIDAISQNEEIYVDLNLENDLSDTILNNDPPESAKWGVYDKKPVAQSQFESLIATQ